MAANGFLTSREPDDCLCCAPSPQGGTSRRRRMIKFYYHPSPNPTKVALFLEEAGLAYEVVPVDTRKGEQHKPDFRAINPNGKRRPSSMATSRYSIPTRSCSISPTRSAGSSGGAADRGELLSWLMFVATGIGPYSGPGGAFQRAVPEQIPYAINRYRREADRHWGIHRRPAGQSATCWATPTRWSTCRSGAGRRARRSSRRRGLAASCPTSSAFSMRSTPGRRAARLR